VGVHAPVVGPPADVRDGSIFPSYRISALPRLCDFCNNRNLFCDDHSMTRIYCFDVANLQQGIGGAIMKSLVVKRSVVVAGHKTSVSLEDAFWKSLKEIAGYRHVTLSALLVAIDSERHHGNLSSAIRLFVLNFYRDQLDVRDRLEATQAMIGRSVPRLT
jgi:predicted DNA-binding ribbon-helix-helix protein